MSNRLLGFIAINDAGTGALQALSLIVLDNENNEIKPSGQSLLELTSIDRSKLDPRLSKTIFQIASNVTNPFLGENGATFSYGRQKDANS